MKNTKNALSVQLQAILRFARAFGMTQAIEWLERAIEAESSNNAVLQERGDFPADAGSKIERIRREIARAFGGKQNIEEYVLINTMLDDIEEKGEARCSGCFGWILPDGIGGVAIAENKEKKAPFVICMSCIDEARSAGNRAKEINENIKGYNLS